MPEWSIEDLKAYHLARPQWSKDGKYISFMQSLWEGSYCGLIDVVSGNYKKLDLESGYTKLTWGPNHSIVNPNATYGDGFGLQFMFINSENKVEDISKRFNKDNANFLESNFSTKGTKIVFTYQDEWGSNNDNIEMGISNIDGDEFIILDEGDIQSPFFSQNDKNIFFVKTIEGKQYLFKYDLINKLIIRIVLLPNKFNVWEKLNWTEEGFLAITGRDVSSKLVMGGNHARLFILDLKKQKIIYASSIYDQFVNFVGFQD